MNGFRKIFPIFLSHYATFFAKMAERKVVPFDEFYYQLKLMHLFQKHLYTLATKLLLISQFSIRMIKTPNLILSENVNKCPILTFGLPRDVTRLRPGVRDGNDTDITLCNQLLPRRVSMFVCYLPVLTTKKPILE
jgi:hypothetical protein